MKPTYEERTEMIGKRYLANVNQPDEMAVTVVGIFCHARGFTVKYKRGGPALAYVALTTFKRRFPHELVEVTP